MRDGCVDLIRGLHNIRQRHSGCVCTIGAFDGVHLGHQAVLGELMAHGRERGLPTTVIVFEPLPREFFAPREAPPRLMSFREKSLALQEFGIDRLVRVKFDDDFTHMTAEAFVEDVLVNGLGARFIMVGDDLRFGAERKGDFRLLSDMGVELGFDVARAPTVEIDDERVSSTRLRGVLQNGDFALAERLLGRPYSISGKVVYGRQLGRTIGSPTANMQLHRLQAPLSGVYVAEVRGVDDHHWPAVVNVGTRPTVDDSIKANVEVHLLDFDGNLYGAHLEVVFLQKIRDEQRFESLDALKEQIQRDIASTRQYFEEAAKAVG